MGQREFLAASSCRLFSRTTLLTENGGVRMHIENQNKNPEAFFPVTVYKITASSRLRRKPWLKSP